MTLVDQLIEELASFEIECSPEKAQLMVHHLELVIERNKVVNLTRIVEPSEAVTLHIVDSLLPFACKEFQLGPDSRFVDMGTGAGFPGIPVGILSEATGALVDSVNKKVLAVDSFAQELGLNRLSALHSRIEDLPKEFLGVQDVVFARAVAQSNVLIEYATPLLKPDGILVLEKGNLSQEEFEHAQNAAKLCGLSNVSRETFELPRQLGHREILLYKKTGKAKLKLPRRAGMAKTSPLGE